MDNFLISAIISVIYFIAKFLEMRYIDNEPKPLKTLIKDSVLVSVCVILGIYIIEQLKPIIGETELTTNAMVFTDNPTF